MSIIRDVTTESEPYWGTDEILLFIGPRQAGKTTVLRQIENRLRRQGNAAHWLTLEDPEYRKLLDDSPRNLFRIIPRTKEKSVVFLDEVQYLRNPSNVLKYLYDEHCGEVKLIVSGSSAFYIDEKFMDSLAGRKRIFSVYTLSFPEFLRFRGKDELCEMLLSRRHLSLIHKKEVQEQYGEFMQWGGFPRVVLSEVPEREPLLRELAYSYVKKDIGEAGVRREDTFYNLMKILAEQTGNLVNTAELANTLDVSRNAIDRYIYILRKSFHIMLPRPFSGSVRSELTKMPKVYWLDMGLRNFFAGSFDSYDVRKDKGQMLENAVYRQLIERQHPDEVRFWRTRSGAEVDFIAEKKALEVKSDIGKVRKNTFRVFRRAYPDISLSVVTHGATQREVLGIPVRNAWEV